jgi:hypothetical protein
VRIIISGNIKNISQDYLSAVIEAIGLSISDVILGGTDPLEQLGKDWAEKHSIPSWTFEPQIGKFRRLAYMVRDKSMVASADGLVLIWDGHDAKSRNLRFLAKQRGLQIYEQIIE